ncbi:GtrA family protein [Hydrogenophilus thermoluteolus]|uniref:GtrA family protein n=1 Tax=Hydrogenophilus thermoluteolus TaxID=297 RepID=UPI0018D53A44|nr:GtrA family protein [Hydrogenophilus thermoluteolus]
MTRTVSMMHSLPPNLKRITHFAFASLFGTAAHYAVLITLVEWAHRTPTEGTAVGFVVGALVNYLLARRWAFPETQSRHREALIKFLLVAASGWGLNTGLIFLATAVAHFPYLAAQVAVTATLFFWHYAANRLWTFRR